MNPWLWLPWLLLFVQTGLAVWAAAAYLLPALELRRALRRLAGDDWDAVAHVHRRGRLDGAVADLAALGERLHRTHRQLGDESLNLQAILGSVAEGVLIVDAAGRVRLANDSVRRMFDLSASPLDRTLMEVFRDHTLQETVRAALATEGPQNRQLTLDVSQGGRYVRKHFTVTVAALHPPPWMQVALLAGAAAVCAAGAEAMAVGPETWRPTCCANWPRTLPRGQYSHATYQPWAPHRVRPQPTVRVAFHTSCVKWPVCSEKPGLS